MYDFTRIIGNKLMKTNHNFRSFFYTKDIFSNQRLSLFIIIYYKLVDNIFIERLGFKKACC